jgi:hypothetical protein
MEGADEHHGHVMARALVDKFDRFLTTFAGYERAFLQAKVRRTDFEVARLSHNSPTELGLKPVTRVANHYPAAVVEWTLTEWGKISNGVAPDERIDEDLISDFAALAKPLDKAAYRAFRVGYGRQDVVLDESAFANAEKLCRVLVAAKPKLPWREGVSHGSVAGELRTVVDDNSERQIIVVPPIGPSRIRCIFPEHLRAAIKENLWQYVKLAGLLHYDNRSPHPYLLEVETLGPLKPVEHRVHLADRVGLFRGAVYEHGVTGGLYE